MIVAGEVGRRPELCGFRCEIPLATGSSGNKGTPARNVALERSIGTYRGRKPRILVVEDDFFLSESLKILLEDAGATVVHVAVSANEAVEATKNEKPDLVLMDIRLVGKRDGVDAAIEIRQKHGARSIFLTANADADNKRRAAPAEPLDWIEKPYIDSAVLEVVRKALAALGGRKPS